MKQGQGALDQPPLDGAGKHLSRTKQRHSTACLEENTGSACLTTSIAVSHGNNMWQKIFLPITKMGGHDAEIGCHVAPKYAQDCKLGR